MGGLGLGNTIRTVLECERVGSLIVWDVLEPVIRWDVSELFPLGSVLAGDNCCRIVQGGFCPCRITDRTGSRQRVPAVSLGSGRPLTFLRFDRSRRHSPDNVLLQEEKEEYDRHHTHRERGQSRVPLALVTSEEPKDSEGNRL